jgi:hypothetical protein
MLLDILRTYAIQDHNSIAMLQHCTSQQLGESPKIHIQLK